MERQELLRKLRDLKPFLQTHYKVRSLGLFGSRVRGEEHPESDIDVLVEFTPDADLLDWIRLMLYLQEVFQCPVDVVPKRSLRTEIREDVLKEVIPV